MFFKKELYNFAGANRPKLIEANFYCFCQNLLKHYLTFRFYKKVFGQNLTDQQLMAPFFCGNTCNSYDRHFLLMYPDLHKNHSKLSCSETLCKCFSFGANAAEVRLGIAIFFQSKLF